MGDTEKDFREAIWNTRNYLHEEFDITFQVEARKMKIDLTINQERMKAKTEGTRREFQTQLKEVKKGAERGRGIGTSSVRCGAT
jgi:hypothetical protein